MHPLPTFTIGGDLTVGRLGFGTMRATTGAGVWGDPADPAAARHILREAVAAGVTFIDTADSYGPGNSEALVADALFPYAPGVVVATKGGAVKYAPGKVYANGRPAYLKQAAEDSLRRLRRETHDLYFLHRPDPEVPFAESVGALADLQREGKIRHVGISNVTLAQLHEARTVVAVAAVQNAFNYVDHRSEDLVRATAELGIAFVAHTPVAAGQRPEALVQAALAQGQTPNQYALRWLLNFGPHIIAIPGTSSPDHLRENLAAGSPTGR